MTVYVLVVRIYGENSWVRGVFADEESAQSAGENILSRENELDSFTVEKYEVGMAA